MASAYLPALATHKTVTWSCGEPPQGLSKPCVNRRRVHNALEIAEYGWSLAGELWTLATRLRDEGASAGDADRYTAEARDSSSGDWQVRGLDQIKLVRTLIPARAACS